MKPFTDTLIEANVRYDDFDKFDGKATYKLGVKYSGLSDVILNANYYTSLNAPSVYQLANVVYGKSLNPSTSNGYDISLELLQKLRLTYFNNTIHNDFIYDTMNEGVL